MTIGTAGFSTSGSGPTVSPVSGGADASARSATRQWLPLLLPILVLGAGIGAVIGIIFVGDPLYTVGAALSLPLCIFAAIAVSRTGPARPIGPALARIESIQRTGVESNGRYECTLRLVVQPSVGAAYQTDSTQLLAAEQLRSMTPGAIIVVTRLGGHRPDVAVNTAPSVEWVAMVEAARRNPSSIASAQNAPLWTTGKQPQVASTGGRLARRFVAILVMIAGAALVLIPAYGSIARAAESIAAGDFGGTSMVTGNYQQLAVDDLAAASGGYQFANIRFYDEYVIATAPTAPGASTADEFTWRFGRSYSQEPKLIQPDDLQAELFDASELDFSMVATVTRDAIAASGFTSFESIYPGVALATSGQKVPVISVYLTTEYESITYVYGFDGELIGSN